MNFGQMEESVYGGNLEEDAELLAELAAIQEEEMGAKKKAAPPATRRAPPAPKSNVPGVDSRALAAALADSHDDGDDDQLEMDDELLNELAGLVGGGSAERSPPPAVPQRSAPAAPVARDEGQLNHLRQLQATYAKMTAEAEKKQESAKVRRCKRAVDKCAELIKAVERGKKIDESEIPVAPPNFEPVPHPAATVAQPSHHPPKAAIREAARVPEPQCAPPPLPERKASAPPPVPARQASSSAEPSDPRKAAIYRVLKHRRDLYVANGKAAIGAHDKEAAKEFVGMAKNFDQAIAALADISAEEMNLDEVPPSPPPYRKAAAAPTPSQSPPKPAAAAPQKPGGFLEALMQRQQRYTQMAEKSKAEGNERKTRMNQRLAGQYADAIKDAKAGRVVNIAELPTLPDMTPLPPQGSSPAPAAAPKQHIRPAPAQVGPMAPSGVAGQSRNSAQLEFLLKRQNEFKQAALHAKNKGDIEAAKKYLMEAKGFDKMIKAAEAGLPVSIKATPIPPQSITPVGTLKPRITPSAESSSLGLEGRGERLALLEKTLIDQVRMAESNQMRFTRLGDVGKVRLFEGWGKTAKQDLLLVREVAKQNYPVPKFHYEMRNIPSADLFPDLAEDVLELTITSCRDIPLPSGYEVHHANLFVKYTFPVPAETPQTGKTKTVAGNISPEFNEVIMLQIGSGKSRNSKLQRTFKRGGLKFEVYQKGGFMRSDKLIGTCEWKLEKLEETAELEESLPLKDGRKAIGGLTSARVRIREPIGDAKAQSQPQKWLILDN